MIIFFPVIMMGQMKSLKSNSKLDTTLSYSAREIRYIREKGSEKILLCKKAVLKYKDVELEADSIIYDLNTQKVYSTFSQDTIFNGAEIDTVKRIGVPELTEGKEKVFGDIIEYNLNLNTGKIKNARTIVKNNKPEDNTYFITSNFHKHKYNDFSGCNAKITSCDLPEPHYHFRADSVIMSRNDWVYAKPITLYFSKVPVFWFPYILYKNQRGRQSGLIIPSYDYTYKKGNGLEHLGYYWFISDYLDYMTAIDYYDHYGYLVKQRLRYNVRYKLNGEANATFVNDHISHNWKIQGFHKQDFSPTMNLKAEYDFATSTALVKKTEETPADRMKNQLNSSMEFLKTWYGNSDYLRLTSFYRQYVDTAIVKYSFPSIDYNYAAIKPFENKKTYPEFFKSLEVSNRTSFDNDVLHNDDVNELESEISGKTSFKESFKYKPYNLTLTFNQELLGEDKKEVFHRKKIYSEDLYQNTQVDSTYNEYAAKTTSELKLSYNHFKFFKTDYSFTYRRDYASKYRDIESNIVSKTEKRDLYSLDVSTGTNIYGFFSPEVLRLSKIRHTISPNINLKYAPDFTESDYGYFLNDSTGKKYDKFRKSLIGRTPSEEELLLSFSLKNILEGKFLKKGGDADIKTLLNLNTTANYNFVRDSNKLSVINTTFDSEIYKGDTPIYGVDLDIDLSGNFEVSPYDLTNHYINSEFDFWRKNPFRLSKYNVEYSVSTPFKFEFDIAKGKSWLKLYNEKFFSSVAEEESNKEKKDSFQELNLNKKSDYFFTSWEFVLDGKVTFSEKFGQVNDIDSYKKSFYMNYNALLKPDENWEISYEASLNFENNKALTSSVIKVLRKMHCWQGLFEWDLFRKGFKLSINTTSDIFKDLKFEKDTRGTRW